MTEPTKMPDVHVRKRLTVVKKSSTKAALHRIYLYAAPPH